MSGQEAIKDYAISLRELRGILDKHKPDDIETLMALLELRALEYEQRRSAMEAETFRRQEEARQRLERID